MLKASWSWDLKGRKIHLCLTGSWEGSGKTSQRRWCQSNILKKGCLHLANGVEGRAPKAEGTAQTRAGRHGTGYLFSITSKGRLLTIHIRVNVWIFKSMFNKTNAYQTSQEPSKIISLECSGNTKSIKTPEVGDWAYKIQILLRSHLLSSVFSPHWSNLIGRSGHG